MAMTITAFLAYLLIGGYFIIERSLRKGEKALSLRTGEFDRGSSKVILTSGLISVLLVVLAPVLNAHQIVSPDLQLGYPFKPGNPGWIGSQNPGVRIQKGADFWILTPEFYSRQSFPL
ncbi:MAG: hypothetical protein VKK04_17000 [Synechococcales bacterium]|nr:hypothetical protein [Synechococcales bacterium]